MIRLLLVLALVGVGADALYQDGAYTQRTWHALSSQVDKLEAVTHRTTVLRVQE